MNIRVQEKSGRINYPVQLVSRFLSCTFGISSKFVWLHEAVISNQPKPALSLGMKQRF